MNLTILGGTGSTGHELLTQALEAGHDVTAFARNPVGLNDLKGRLRVVIGGLDDEAAMADAVRGADVVLSALGSREGGAPTTVYSDSARAMLRAGAKRLVALSAVPAAPDHDKTFLERRIVHPTLHKFFGGSYDDMRRMEAILSASDVDWTVLRPPRLTNGAARGTYRTSTTKLRRPSSISRADLAAAMLATADDASTARHAVTVSY